MLKNYSKFKCQFCPYFRCTREIFLYWHNNSTVFILPSNVSWIETDFIGCFKAEKYSVKSAKPLDVFATLYWSSGFMNRGFDILVFKWAISLIYTKSFIRNIYSHIKNGRGTLKRRKGNCKKRQHWVLLYCLQYWNKMAWSLTRS